MCAKEPTNIEDSDMLANKTTTKSGYCNGQIYAGLACIFLIFALSVLASCGNVAFELTSENDEDDDDDHYNDDAIKAALKDRSFRQFEPDVDASPRKGVILDFF